MNRPTTNLLKIREIRVIRDNPRFAAYLKKSAETLSSHWILAFAKTSSKNPKCNVHSDTLPQNRINLRHNRKRLRNSHQNRTILLQLRTT